MVTHQKLEEVAHVIAEVLVTREETEICVDARCRRVVVPGTDVHVLDQLFTLATNDERGLGVRLDALDAVRDVTSRGFQTLGKVYISRLVETRLELDEHGDLLTVLRRLDQSLDDWRVITRAVQRRLDGQHIRVSRGLFDECLRGRRE